MNTPNISVVVVTYCRPLELKRCLEALSQQSLTPHEVVVVDNGAAMALGTAYRIDKGLTDYLEQKDRDYAGSSIGKHNALAVPAVYVVDRSGEIVFDFVNPDYKIRLPAEDLLAAANKLVNKTAQVSQ